MVTGSLPEDGELQLGPVRLPAGRRIIPLDEDTDAPLPPVAWVTSQLVPDAGLVWSALSGVHHETGLVPVLLADEEDGDDFYFAYPEPVTQVDPLDAGQLLAGMWHNQLPSDAENYPAWRRMRAPYFRQFPGLAPPEHDRLSMAQQHQTLGSRPAARLGLVPASRPADALPVTGWMPFDDHLPGLPNPVWIAAILRSWETRFGATLLHLGPGAVMQLLVERPPHHLAAAQPVAAEHHVFCDECGGAGLREVSKIAAALINAPIWTFWWD